ncbi:hypothetical protein HOO54_00955 [Bacillus sp. WMMC1349]|uniref:hypothetical protein n=1 Tax=Bacillus sp. WMMC1349 TaxID=2736254 RepID=UPI0015539CA9|nr:hypothetical protein [Bacillus sp. WMMC1349]NPC90872.1 hypothetical protein [Bacillus sp. WMMC1349]
MTAEFFQRFTELEKDLFQLVASVGGRRLTEDQLIYINRYNFLRDIDHSVVEEQRNVAKQILLMPLLIRQSQDS